MSEDDPDVSSGRGWESLKRRQFLLGTGAAVSGVGYFAQDDGNTTAGNGNNSTVGNGDNATAGEEAGDEPAPATTGVHPVFGFAGESAEIEPPVSPDHIVTLEIRFQEGQPIPEFFFEPTGLYVEPGETVLFYLLSPDNTVTAYHPNFGQTQRVPEGVGSISSPFLWPGAYFLYTFDEPGVYDLYSAPNEVLGMTVRVVAGEATGPGTEPVPEPEYEQGLPVGGTEGRRIPGRRIPGRRIPGRRIPGGEQPSDEEEEEILGEEEEVIIAEQVLELRPPAGLAASVLRDPNLDPENIIERGSVGWDDLDPESKMFVPQPAEDESPTGNETEGTPDSEDGQ